MGCAATDVVEFTHDATTALSANDKVTISGVQNPLSILATAALTGTKPAITGHATGGESTNVGTTGGTGSGLVVTVVTADGTPPTLTSVTVTTAGTGYKPGDVITVTGAGSSTAGDFNSFSMTLQPGDFDGTSIASSTYTANVGPNMLKTGKNRQFLKITNIECAATDVVEFTHDATTALSANDKVTISGVQNPLSILATAALTGTKPAITGHATGGESTNVGTTGGTGSGLVVTVVTADGTPPTLTSVTVTTAGTGYKSGDVITVTGAGNSNAGEFNSFSMTLQRDDFAAAENLRAGFYNAEHTVTGTPTTTKFRAAGAGCSGSGTA